MPFDFGDFQEVPVGEYGTFDFGSIFEELFGGARGGPRARTRHAHTHAPAEQGAHAEAELTVDLRDAVLGAERDVRVDNRTLRVKSRRAYPMAPPSGSRARGARAGTAVTAATFT